MSLVTESDPGTAFWSPAVVVAGRVTFNIADGPTKTVTVPAGLENAPVFVDFVSWPGNTAGGGFGLAGGILYATISGTTLTINLNDQTVNANGCIVSYVVTGPA